jgi:hypothetical protein
MTTEQQEGKSMIHFHEKYFRNVSDLPPVSGEVVEPGMNYCWFSGYSDRSAAFRRFCELTAQNIPPELEDEVCRHFGITTEFQLHY